MFDLSFYNAIKKNLQTKQEIDQIRNTMRNACELNPKEQDIVFVNKGKFIKLDKHLSRDEMYVHHLYMKKWAKYFGWDYQISPAI